VGDLVISANGSIVHKYDDLLKSIRNSKVGDELKLTCSRDKKTVEITIKMAERPKPKENAESGGESENASPITGTRRTAVNKHAMNSQEHSVDKQQIAKISKVQTARSTAVSIAQKISAIPGLASTA